MVLLQLEPAPTPSARSLKNPEIHGPGKAYKSGLEKEDHLGKMTRTDTLTGSGSVETRVETRIPPPLQGRNYPVRFTPVFHSNERDRLSLL